MSDAARAKDVYDLADAAGHASHYQDAADGNCNREYCLRCAFVAGAYAAAEQTTAKDAEIERLTMKVEQYKAQLDDRWAGVVGVVDQHVEQTAALRAFVQELVDETDRLPFANLLMSQHGKAMLERARALLAAPEGPPPEHWCQHGTVCARIEGQP